MLRQENYNRITIHSENQDIIRRIVSRLLLMEGKGDVTWTKQEVYITTSKNHIPYYARMLVSTWFGIIMNDLTSEELKDDENWHIWKDDFRFRDFLLNDERYEAIKEELTLGLNSGYISIEQMIQESPTMKSLITSILDAVVSGAIAEKMKQNGYV